jgi:hypothetical protein
MQVPLRAYAEDCSFTGEVVLTADRLSDFLAATDEFDVMNLSCRALDDGRVVDALFAPLVRDDLCLVAAGEPRGREELRVWTRQYPVIVHVGPYVVRGYVHAPPTIYPLRLPERRSILALTNASVSYAEAGNRFEIEMETVLVNSARIEAFEATTDDEVGGNEARGEPEAWPPFVEGSPAPEPGASTTG